MANDESTEAKKDEPGAPEGGKAEVLAPKAEGAPDPDVELKVHLTVELEAKQGTRRISLSLETVRNLTSTEPAAGVEDKLMPVGFSVGTACPHGATRAACGATRGNCPTKVGTQ